MFLFRNLQIGTRLTLVVTAVVVLILMVVTFIATRSSDVALRDQTLNRFSTKSVQVIARINSQFQTLENSTTALATAVRNMGDVNASNELRQVVADFARSEQTELIARYSVLRPDGRVGTLSLQNPLIPDNFEWRVYSFASDIPDAPEFREPLQTGEPRWFVQKEAFYDVFRQPAITISVPYQINGRLAGVVWVDIPRDKFQLAFTNLLNDEGLLADTETGYATLIDPAGYVLAANNLDIRENQLSDEISAAVAALRDTATSGLTPSFDPITRLDAYTASRRFALNNFRFLADLPLTEIPVLPSGVLGPIFIIATIGVLILVFIINLFTRRSVAEPLQRLGTSALEIGAGDLRYFIAYRDRKDEIGRLASALEDMRISLESSYDELSRWGRTLERRVVDRTKELDSARQEAQSSATELRAIYNESLLVVNETQLKPILDALSARMINLLSATYSAVWLLNEDRDRLQLVATNASAQREGITILVGEGIVGQAVQQAQPIRLDEYSQYAYNLRLPETDGTAPFERAIAVPLTYVGRPIGAIIVGRPADQPSFNDDDQRLLTLFANLISPSVRNAQLFVRMNSAIDSAERANQVKTRFLASVTHELRTPLNLVINNMDFMRIGAFGEVNREQHERLGQTVRSAEHLLYLINDLLDVSKIEAGEMQLFIQEHDILTMLDDCLDNTVSFMEKIEGKTNLVEFVMDIDDDLPKIPMDVRRIRQVLTNLLTNAVKFTEHGTVSLMVRRQAEGVEFAVRDTGMGIPTAETDKLFAPFERTDGAKESNIEGTGLGLPISKYLVEQHGGTLSFESEVGVGTTFHFTLPYVARDVHLDATQRSNASIAAMLSSQSQ